jgi:hypothetical protein
MYDWTVVKVANTTELESKLNSFEQTGWEVFQIIPVPTFQEHKVMMVTVPLPISVQYEIVFRKNKEEVINEQL